MNASVRKVAETHGCRVAGGERHVEPHVDVSIDRLASPVSAFRRSCARRRRGRPPDRRTLRRGAHTDGGGLKPRVRLKAISKPCRPIFVCGRRRASKLSTRQPQHQLGVDDEPRRRRKLTNDSAIAVSTIVERDALDGRGAGGVVAFRSLGRDGGSSRRA